MFWPVPFTYYTVYIFKYNQGQSRMSSMSKHLVYSEMRRGKYFLKTHHLTVKAGFVIPSLCAGSAKVGWGGCCCALLPESGTDRVQGRLRCGVSRTAWHMGSIAIAFCLSWCAEGAHHCVSGAVPREPRLWGWCHQDWHSAPNSWGHLRNGPLEVSSCSHASGKLGNNTTFKILSEKNFRSGGKYEENASARFIWSFPWKNILITPIWLWAILPAQH